jgi:hypothetical protein
MLHVTLDQSRPGEESYTLSTDVLLTFFAEVRPTWEENQVEEIEAKYLYAWRLFIQHKLFIFHGFSEGFLTSDHMNHYYQSKEDCSIVGKGWLKI